MAIRFVLCYKKCTLPNQRHYASIYSSIWSFIHPCHFVLVAIMTPDGCGVGPWVGSWVGSVVGLRVVGSSVGSIVGSCVGSSGSSNDGSADERIADLGRVSSEEEKRVCSRWTRSQREHIFKNFNCPKREWAKWVSEPMNGASKSECRKAKLCRAS